MFKNFFSDKNIMMDILEEMEKENNKKIDDIYKNIYNNILMDDDITELKKCYPIILLNSYAKDRGKNFDILDPSEVKELIKFIYHDRTKTVLKMVLNKLNFNFYTNLSEKNKMLIKKELKKLI